MKSIAVLATLARECMSAAVPVCVLAGALCLPGQSHAVPSSVQLQKEQQSKKQEQLDVKGEISSIKSAIDKKQDRLDRISDELRKSETAISESNRKIKEVGESKAEIESKLRELGEQSRKNEKNISDALDSVESISRTQFLNLRTNRWHAVLKGENPNEIERMSGVLGYLAKEQVRIMGEVEEHQREIDRQAGEMRRHRRDLVSLEKEERERRSQLEREKRDREVARKGLRAEIDTDQKRYEQLVANDRQLSDLISNLGERIELAERAEREAERKRREKEIAEAKRREREIAEAQKRSREQAAKLAAAKAEAERKKRLEEQRRLAESSRNFAGMKGRLLMPTNGTVAARFGQKRSGASSDLPWRGMLIRGKMGQPVRATAAGTVVFSDWMRGFGNLMIIDHGANYLSVYANNESLYKSVGDKVARGDSIASLGNSGGEDVPGLYFELRYKGKPFDPAGWLAK